MSHASLSCILHTRCSALPVHVPKALTRVVSPGLAWSDVIILRAFCVHPRPTVDPLSIGATAYGKKMPLSYTTLWAQSTVLCILCIHTVCASLHPCLRLTRQTLSHYAQLQDDHHDLQAVQSLLAACP